MPLLVLVLPAGSALASDTYDASRPENLRTDQLRAQSAILIDAQTGNTLYEKNADDSRFPASTTKIMTVYLGLIMAENLEELVTISESAVTIPEGSSRIELKAGEQIRFDDLLKATMVASGNDGAIAIAEHISGSEQAFVALMNEAARNMGALHTQFVNSHGYHDDNHFSTARDLALIAKVAMENEQFREIASLYSYTLERNEWSAARRLSSFSRVLMQQSEGDDGQYYYPFINGIKTGRTSKAGSCFVGSAEKDGVKLISVVLQNTNYQRCWTDTKKLMEYGFSQFISTSIEQIYAQNPKVIDISSYDLGDANLGRLELNIRKLDPTADDHLIGFAGETDSWLNVYNERTTTVFIRKLEAPIEEGEVVGTMTYSPQDPNKEPIEYELTASRSVARRPSLAPSVEEINAYSDADPNPFPRFSLEFLAIVLLPVGAVVVLSQVLYKLLNRKKKPKIKTRRNYKTRHYR
ncbi:MAG: D-alanyl-D-alanine carboxypeptidase [Clostridiales bacterium]|nr:D-alanyl-D-alanine carboxypeptidase [Clostridiales bacterium]